MGGKARNGADQSGWGRGGAIAESLGAVVSLWRRPKIDNSLRRFFGPRVSWAARHGSDRIVALLSRWGSL